MARFPINRDKRRTQRYPVSEPRDEGELRLGENRFPVLVLDESAGGFAVAAENPAGIIQGELGLLRAGKDWYEVRVVKIMPMPPPEDAPPLNLDAIPADAAAAYARQRKSKFRAAFRQKAQYRIGLTRLRDAADPDIKTAEVFRILLALRMWEHFPGRGFAKLFGAMFLVLAVGTAAAGFLIWSGRDGAGRSAWESGEERAVRPGADSDESGSRGAYRYSLQKKFREVLRHSLGAVTFLEPEVSEELQLTGSQRQSIRTIAEETQKEVMELRQKLPPAESPDQYARYEKQIYSQAREKALRTLTNQQRDHWYALSGEGPR